MTVAFTALALVGGLVLLPGAGTSGVGASSSGGGDTRAPETTVPDATIPETSSTSTTSTPTSTTTSTTVATAPTPLPLAVAPARILVGPRDVARITGTCPAVDGEPLGPVTIWEVGSTITAVETTITAAAWTYDWRSPATADVGALQVWCGDPDAWTGGYPAELQIEVVYVAQDGPTGSVAGDSAVRVDPAAALPTSR